MARHSWTRSDELLGTAWSLQDAALVRWSPARASELRPGQGFRSAGLGLVAHVRFGVHWNRVPGLPGVKRFMTAGIERADAFVGIDEMTAIAGDGARWRVFGAGRVEVRRLGDRSFFSAGEEFSLL